MGDIWLLIFIVGIPIGFALYSKGMTRILWLGCLGGMFGVLGGCEAYCKFVDPAHLTLSQRFYALPDGAAWAITGLLAIGWLGLLMHLNWRRITKLFKKDDTGSASTDQPTHNEAKKGEST